MRDSSRAFLVLLFAVTAILFLSGKAHAEGRLVSVGDHKLFLNCTGIHQGATILLLAGANDTTAIWDKVQPAIANFTEVCSYDRLGLGQSDHFYYTQSVEQITQDLHALLENGDIAPPYILVGHSMGGIYARSFASAYPTSTGGLIFVDSAHEEQVWRFARISKSLLFEYPDYPNAWKLSQEGFLPDGKRLDWHLDVPLIVLEHGITWPRYDFKGMSPEQYEVLKQTLNTAVTPLTSTVPWA